ncbi:MAG: inorganic phosphate transporter [Candidatus Nitrosocaldaceae archaeon]
MIELLSLYLAFILGMNNAGLLSGTLVAGGMSYRNSIIIIIIGFIIGFVIEGEKIANTLESISKIDIEIQLVVTSILLTIFTIIGMPVSMVNLLIAAHIGKALAINAEIDLTILASILIAWIIAPLVTILSSIILYEILKRMVNNISLLSLNKFYSIATLVTTFYMAYALSANNIALLSIDSLSFILPFMAIIGMINKKVAFVISEDIVGQSRLTILSTFIASSSLLWLFTQFSIPISLTQMVLAGLIVNNLHKRPRIYNKSKLLMLVTSSILSTITSLLIAYYLPP